MKNKIRKTITALLFIIIVFGTVDLSAFAYSSQTTGKSYTYNQSGDDVFIPDPYVYKESISLTDKNGIAANNPSDFYISKSKDIYVVDTSNDRIMVYGSDFKLKKLITQLNYKGETITLNKPEGIYVSDDNIILIADTKNERIIKCDANANVSLIITKPANMTGVDEKNAFLPVKVSADSIGRIYVVAKNVNNGIIRLDSKGIFMGYIGAPKVQYDFYTLLKKKYFTKKQKSKLEDFVPTEYNNIYIDKYDFVWGTISQLSGEDIVNAIAGKDKSGNITPIRKLNSMGNDILKRNGDFAPLGDLSFTHDDEKDDAKVSRILDVAISDNGIYSMLDQTKGHIFTYDDNGKLLYIFGNLGFKKSDFQKPVSINYLDKKILVLDSSLKQIKVFEPTKYGELVLEAENCQYNGNFENAYKVWSEIAHQNTNFTYAFVGLGNAKLKEGKYSEALEYFKYANDTENYSKTFVLIRKEKMKVYFPIIFAVILILITASILYSISKKAIKYYKGI